jgi:hypothetical protein
MRVTVGSSIKSLPSLLERDLFGNGDFKTCVGHGGAAVIASR